MSEVVMRVGRVCPVCGRDGRDGQSVVQVVAVGDDKIGCPNCETEWPVGAVHGAKPEPAKAAKGKAGAKEEK